MLTAAAEPAVAASKAKAAGPRETNAAGFCRSLAAHDGCCGPSGWPPPPLQNGPSAAAASNADASSADAAAAADFAAPAATEIGIDAEAAATASDLAAPRRTAVGRPTAEAAARAGAGRSPGSRSFMELCPGSAGKQASAVERFPGFGAMPTAQTSKMPTRAASLTSKAVRAPDFESADTAKRGVNDGESVPGDTVGDKGCFEEDADYKRDLLAQRLLMFDSESPPDLPAVLLGFAGPAAGAAAVGAASAGANALGAAAAVVYATIAATDTVAVGRTSAGELVESAAAYSARATGSDESGRSDATNAGAAAAAAASKAAEAARDAAVEQAAGAAAGPRKTGIPAEAPKLKQPAPAQPAPVLQAGGRSRGQFPAADVEGAGAFERAADSFEVPVRPEVVVGEGDRGVAGCRQPYLVELRKRASAPAITAWTLAIPIWCAARDSSQQGASANLLPASCSQPCLAIGRDSEPQPATATCSQLQPAAACRRQPQPVEACSQPLFVSHSRSHRLPEPAGSQPSNRSADQAASGNRKTAKWQRIRKLSTIRSGKKKRSDTLSSSLAPLPFLRRLACITHWSRWATLCGYCSHPAIDFPSYWVGRKHWLHICICPKEAHP